jgi:hypothetical protein
MDPFRLQPGVDRPGTFGTLLRCTLVRKYTQSNALRNVLVNSPGERGQLFGNEPEVNAGGGYISGYGRTSYVLLQHPTPPQLPVHFLQSCVVTAMAGVTRHLPVAVTFQMGEHEDYHHSYGGRTSTRAGSSNGATSVVPPMGGSGHGLPFVQSAPNSDRGGFNTPVDAGSLLDLSAPQQM